MAMRLEHEVKDMLQRFDQADEDDILDCDGEAVRTALLWVMGHDRGADLEEMLEEM
jgi:hypothetical protein